MKNGKNLKTVKSQFWTFPDFKFLKNVKQVKPKIPVFASPAFTTL